MGGSQLEMGDLGEKAYEACLASRATVGNLRPEENLPSKSQDTVLVEGYSRVVCGKQILDILSNTFRYGHRSVPLQLQLLGSICRLSTFGLCRSHKRLRLTFVSTR